jgi:hypothetical protein
LDNAQAKLDEIQDILAARAAANTAAPVAEEEDGEVPGETAFSRSEEAMPDVSDPQTGISVALIQAAAENPGMFKFPISDALSMEDIAADKTTLDEDGKEVHATVTGVDKSDDSVATASLSMSVPDDAPSKNIKSWMVKLPSGRYGTITREGNELYINAEKVRDGLGGSLLYDIAHNFAINNGLTFVGDPRGISEAGMRRRLENMLSGAIKYGTTDAIQPHPEQFIGNKDAGLPPLDWKKGDTLGNIRRMIDASIASNKALSPKASNELTYDSESGSFGDFWGVPQDNAGIADIVGGDKRVHARGQGRITTLQRSALFQSLLRSPEERRDFLVQLRREPVRGGKESGGTLRGTFYSRGAVSPTGGLGVKPVQGIIDVIKARWTNAPEIVVAANMDDPVIPVSVRDYNEKQKMLGAKGEPMGFVHGGKVYVIANQLTTPGHVIEVLFHESLGHIGLRGAFGKGLEQVLNQIVVARKAEVEAKARKYGLDVNKKEDMLKAAEEVLAELAQSHPELGFVKRAIAAIRTWLRENIPSLQSMKLSDNEIINNFILPARAFVEGGYGIVEGSTAMAQSSGNWYSELTNQVLANKQESMPASQWSSWINSLATKGVKAAEIEWSGVQDWLKLQSGKVSKAQVAEYLDGNGVQVSETQYSNDSGEAEYRRQLAEMDDEELQSQADMNDVDWEGLDRQQTIEAIIRGYHDDIAYGLGQEEGSTKYRKYTLPGATNYREVLLTLPVRDQAGLDADEEARRIRAEGGRAYRGYVNKADYQSNHWRETPNVLAHIRLNDRVDADGKKVLFVEEIQSDWAQEGKKKGFAKVANKEELKALRDAVNEADTDHDNAKSLAEKAAGDVKYWKQKVDKLAADPRTDKSENYAAAGKLRDAIEKSQAAREESARTGAVLMEAMKAQGNAESPAGIANAPFVGKTESWVSLALKRVIKMAVDEGYDKVALVNGDQSADRYDLSKQISKIEYEPTDDGKFEVVAFGLNGEKVLEEDEIPLSRVEELVGKEIAQKMQDGEGSKSSSAGGYRNWHTLSGLALKVGGEGMKTFYDTIVPNIAKDVVKKVGGKLEKFSMGQEAKDGWWADTRANPDGTHSVYHDNSDGDSQFSRAFPTLKEAEAFAEEKNNAKVTAEKASREIGDQLGFTITDAMRDKANKGMPMFQRNKNTVSGDVPQSISSAATSRKQVPAAMKQIAWAKDTVNLDIGAGKFSDATAYLADQGVTNLEFDPFNRSEQENYDALMNVIGFNGADTVTALNVLNVIKEPFARDNVIRRAAKAVSKDGTAYFQTYEGDKSGKGAPSRDGWQENRATASYIGEIEKYFGHVVRRGQVIEASLPNKNPNDSWKDKDGGIAFSRSSGKHATVRDYTAMATAKLNEIYTHPGTISMWDKTVGSMYHLASKSPAFKAVFDTAQSFINDVSYYANEAADLAPKILPRMEHWKDLLKSPLSAADNKAIADPILQGTMGWARDETGKAVKMEDLEARYEPLTDEEKAQMLLRRNLVSEAQLKRWQASKLDIYSGAVNNRFNAAYLTPGVVWTDAELKSIFNLNDAQIGLYKEFRAATDKSLDNMAKADLLRYGGKDVEHLVDMVMDAPDADAAAILLRDELFNLSEEDPERSDVLIDTANGMVDRGDKTRKLKERGYAPLSRFGRYTVDVVVDGEREYFSLFESKGDANRMAAKMAEEFGAENVAQGTLSQKEFEQFQGITPETMELFGNMMGLDSTGDEASDKAFQQYLKLTKNNRSAMKRLIHRKGTAGFSNDIGRILAAFVYSNSRSTSAALHMGALGDAVNDIPKSQGELKDAAIELSQYIKNPREEAQALRGLIFAQYLGGSVASALVNFTQPFAISFPYLSQFGGALKSGNAIKQAMVDQTKGIKLEPNLAAALKHAEEDGVVSPQAVHELQAQAAGRAALKSGDGTKRGDAWAHTQNGFSKLALGWGKLFGMAEQINRRSTFIAAYRMAVDYKKVLEARLATETGAKRENTLRQLAEVKNPKAFAYKAVNDTQFISNKANKAKWARGAIGGTLMTFKSYSTNYLELFARLAKKGGPEGKQAAALMLFMLFVMAGAGGLPFEQDLEDIIDFFAQRMGYNFNSGKARQEFLERLAGKSVGSFLDKGITGLPGSPIDVAGRMGMGNLIPGTGLLLEKKDHTQDLAEFAGPAGDMLKRGFTAVGQALDGDLMEAAMSISPKAVSNARKGAQMAQSDMYKDAKGYKVIETTPMQAALKAIGFQPHSVAQVQESNFQHLQAKDFYIQHSQDINARWAKGIFENNQSQIDKARKMIADWNLHNPDQPMHANMAAIQHRVKEMRKPKDQRIADTAPKAMRAQFKRDVQENRLERQL